MRAVDVPCALQETVLSAQGDDGPTRTASNYLILLGSALLSRVSKAT
jgi:hypothetical protein